MQDGIYLNIANEQYDKIDAIRSSFLKSVLENPRLAWFEKMNILPKEQTPSMLFGTLLHEAILEPEKYNTRVVAGNQSKADKEIPSDKKISASNKEKIDAIIKMWNIGNYKSKKLIADSYKEIVIITNGKKCKIDFLKFGKNNDVLIGDIKTTSKIDNVGLSYMIRDYNYVFQLAYYKKLLEEAINRVKNNEMHSDIDVSKIKIIKTMLIFFYTSPPFDVRFFNADNDICVGDNDVEKALNKTQEQVAKYGFNIEKPWDSCFIEDTNSDNIIIF